MWTTSQKGAKKVGERKRMCAKGRTRNTFSLHEKLLKELIVSLVVDVRCNLLVVCAMEK